MQHQCPSIEVLPPLVVEKIAAGEVIERPASVLKELIENAIDAGATAIDVSIEAAGFSLIRVVDNGSGMSPADLGKSVLPHATSKIRTADDLFAVTTLGFRGEALSSIAAVSRMRIASSADSGGLGAELLIEGGVSAGVTPVSHARGTSIEARDLFYNVPARKKFMKSSRGEQLAAIRVVEQVAVPFPLIHFTCTVDGRRVLDAPPVDTPLARIGSVAGMEFAKGLIECRISRSGMDAAVYVSSPREPQTRARYQSLYVNLRRVECDSVIYAIREAFEQFLSGRYRPSFFCFIDIDPSRIDVNVHPTKQQVKFEDERSLFGFIFSAVKQGIGGGFPLAADVFGRAKRPESSGDTHSGPLPAAATPEPFQERLRFVARETVPNRFSAPPETDVDGFSDREKSDGATAGAGKHHDEAGETESGRQTVFPFLSASPHDHKEIDGPGGETIQLTKELENRTTDWDLISCYQIHGMYILAPMKNGILLIDQHAAHERILFEQALADIAMGRSPSQQLLFPVVVELSAVEKAVVTAGQSFFTAFGFEVSDFGGNALSVSSLPFFMRVSEVEETMRSMVRYLLGEKERDAVRETEKRFAAAFACGAAIKAGQKLSQEEMNALVNSLFATKNPYICPHGRPTLVRISLEELSRRFLR